MHKVVDLIKVYIFFFELVSVIEALTFRATLIVLIYSYGVPLSAVLVVWIYRYTTARREGERSRRRQTGTLKWILTYCYST